MSSTIFYRFRSQKDTSRIQFDGTGITVFDLKKEIIAENKLGDGSGFELRVYNADTEEEFSDDTLVIPRSSSIVARRSPPNKPGKGGASRYVTGKPRITKVTLNNPANSRNNNSNNNANANTMAENTAMSEEDRIAMMFSNQSDQWQQTQQEMSSAKAVYTARPQQSANSTEDAPPPGYMCYRCGSKDHWIKNCPTNDDPNWEGKRIKRTTGIPKTYLQTVDKPEDDSSKTFLMNEEGKYVVQVADSKAWDAFKKRANKGAELQDLTGVDPELIDPISKKIMNDPVVTPCCGKSYSRMSIEDALVESDFVCPNCATQNILLDQLKSDEEKKRLVDEVLVKRGVKRRRSEDETLHASNQNPPPVLPAFPAFPAFPVPQGGN